MITPRAPLSKAFARHLLVAVAVCACVVATSDAVAQSHRHAGPAMGLIESGAPPFAILGQESLGLNTPPTDLRLLPDGRLLVVASQQLALGDGIRWETFRQSPADPVTAGVGVAVDRDGSMYIGTSHGFGRIELIENNFWRLVAASPWPSGMESVRTIPRSVIMVNDEWLWHSGSGPVFSWKPGQTARIAGHADDVEHVFSLAGASYLSDRNQGGLYRISSGTMERVLASPDQSPNSAITSTLPFEDGRLLVGTHGEGLQLFDGSQRVPFSAGSALAAARINDLCLTEGGMFAAAVEDYGIVFFDRQGRTIQALTRTLDHRLSGIKRLLPAAGGVIWGLLDRGILRVEFPSHISHFEAIVGTGVNNAHPYRLDGKLWFLADGKVQRAAYDSDGHLSHVTPDTPPGLYAFTLSTALGVPVVGTSRGAFYRDESGWQPFALKSHNLRILERSPRNGRWLYGARGETGWLRRTADGIEVESIAAPELLDVYDAATGRDGTVWIEMGSGRLGRIMEKNGTLSFQSYDTQHGIPESWAQVFELDGVVSFNVSQQILRFDEASSRFVRDRDLERRTSVSEIYGRPGLDSAGRLWIATLNGVRVMEREGDQWRPLPWVISPQLRPYHFTFEADGVVWMHSERRLERYNPQMAAPAPAPLRALITQVNVAGANRSFFPSNGKIPELEYSENSLVVHFSAPENTFNAPVTFEVNLEGSDSTWTSTGSSGTAVFNRLKEGNYVLHVRPRTDQRVGSEAALAFSIRAPWYRTNLAYGGYALSGLSVLLLAAWTSSYLQRRESSRLEKLVAERTQELNTSRDRLAKQVDEIRMLSHAIEQSPIAVFVTQTDGTIEFANPRACESSGYSPDELITKNIRMLRADSTVMEGNGERIVDAVNTAGPWRGQLTNRRKDGRIVDVRTMIAPIRTPHGKIRHHVILEEDITEWLADQERGRKLEAQLFQAQKLESIGTLAGGIAHDFNNILTGILGYCELARLAARGNAAVISELKEVVTAGMRAKDLVAQILTFSRKSSVQLATLDLLNPVTEALKLVRASIPSSIQIVNRTESGLVRADATQIQQVVLNLCTNAVHAMRDRAGILSVIVQRITVVETMAGEIPNLAPGDWMRLTVSDNGSGMDATTLNRIFDPFFTTKRQGEGTGLGLSIVQGIVTSHKGALRVRSDVETGTIFEIYLPVSSEKSISPSLEQLVPQGSQQEIIVVDDERAVASFAATRLQQLGYVTTLFFDPRLALDAFNSDPERFDGLVTDLTMPDMTGLDLIRHIRAHGRVVPAVIITGYGSDTVRTSLDALPRCLVVQKPFSGEDLARALDQVLKQDNSVHRG